MSSDKGRALWPIDQAAGVVVEVPVLARNVDSGGEEYLASSTAVLKRASLVSSANRFLVNLQFSYL